jgi:hypothetical protein
MEDSIKVEGKDYSQWLLDNREKDTKIPHINGNKDTDHSVLVTIENITETKKGACILF